MRDRAGVRPGQHDLEACQSGRRSVDANLETGKSDGGPGQFDRDVEICFFDLDLALDTSEANPVYKIQYAHARMCSVFRKAGIDETAIEPTHAGLDRLDTEAEREVAKTLLRLPEAVRAASDARAPHILCAYLEETAGLVNSWYHRGNLDRGLRVLAEGPAREGRLKLARAVQITLRNGLAILGLGAPRSLSRDAE